MTEHLSQPGLPIPIFKGKANSEYHNKNFTFVSTDSQCCILVGPTDSVVSKHEHVNDGKTDHPGNNSWPTIIV